jgi:hypothetical protein
MPSEDQRKDQNIWNVVALLIYAATCCACMGLIAIYGTTPFDGLRFFDLAIIGLATFRLIHLLTFDKVFDGCEPLSWIAREAG